MCFENRRDIIENAAAGDCPLGKFTEPQASVGLQPPLTPLIPVPRDKWPAWANLVAARATPSDIGVGSTIERELGRVGVAFKAVLATLGVPCGCADRRDEWDALYPYHMPANGSSGE